MPNRARKPLVEADLGIDSAIGCSRIMKEPEELFFLDSLKMDNIF